MRISPTTIERVTQVDIVDVVSRYVSLKKKGTSHWACCPFHTESSPSFSVSVAKQIYKCFGCGEAGNGIRFVMQHEKVEFVDAVKSIAGAFSIPIEYENLTEEQTQEQEQLYREKQSMRLLLAQAAATFQGYDIPEAWMGKRAFDEKALNKFSVGYTGEGKNNLAKALLTQGWTSEQLAKAGLIREHTTDSGEKLHYDFYQNRIIFPIHDARGNVVAFSGRILNDEPKAAGTENKDPKYINSPDTVWTKGHHLYGLHLAIQEIQKKGYAYLVEGNPDVIRFHQVGIYNVVAPCGTALTMEQIKLLKRYTSRVTIVGDNDAAGRKAVHKNAQLLIENGLDAKVLLPKTGGMDPDDYIRKFKTKEELTSWLNSDLDYISGYFLGQCLGDAEISPVNATEAIRDMANVVLSIPDDILRSVYHGKVCSLWPDFKKNVKLPKTDTTYDTGTLDEDERARLAEQFEYGFYERGGCYYTKEKKSEVRICPFTMKILFYVVSDNQPKYVCRFIHTFGRVTYRAITTDDFSSVGTFKRVVERMKGFVFEGSQSHLDKIKIKLFYGVKEALEPQFMGYNQSGNFYTWSNGLFYNGSFYKSDRYGIVNLQKTIKDLDNFNKLPPESIIIIGETEHVVEAPDTFLKKYGPDNLKKVLDAGLVSFQMYYYLPFSASLKLTEDSDDDYELERKFKHNEKSKLTFKEWAKRMVEVYGDNGVVMVCFLIGAVNRSVIYKANNNYFPILFNAGARGGGKSKAAESLARCFGDVIEDGVNLESGSTTTGITRYMSSVQDGMIWLNEYKNTLPLTTLGMLKGISDGSGKLTGRATQGNQTRSQKPKSTAVICGQDVPTRDPAMLSRAIINEFSVADSKNEKAFDELKELEKEGYTTAVTNELLMHRESIRLQYRVQEPVVTKELKNLALSLLDAKAESRAILNLSSLLVPAKILMEKGLEFPFTYEKARDILLQRLRYQVDVQSVSDDCEQYFLVVQSLIKKEIFEGEHFKIQRESDGVKLFIRIKIIQNYYLAAALRQGITPLSLATIRSYLLRHKAFIETRDKGVDFPLLANRTSAYVFDYEKLVAQGIEFKTEFSIRKMEQQDDPSKKVKVNGNIKPLLVEFIKQQPVNKILKVEDMLKEFNSNKEPGLAKTSFIKEMMEYLENNTRDRDFSFLDKNYDRLKISEFIF